MLRLLRALLCICGLAATALSAEIIAANYATKLKFREGVALKFPDFELSYAGKHRVAGPAFPRGWWVHDFIARTGKAEQKLSWSSGTGDIGPTRFTVGGKSFALELSRSDKLGPLKEDEIVVSRPTGGN